MSILIGIASAAQSRQHGGKNAMLVSINRFETGNMEEGEKEVLTAEQRSLAMLIEAAVYRAVKEAHGRLVIGNVVIRWHNEQIELIRK
jgi:hypothetical protein